MFIKTIKFSRKRALLIVLAAAVLLACIVLLTGRGGDSSAAYRMKAAAGIKTNEGRIEYLSRLGWDVEREPVDEQNILIPKEFSKIYADYNDLQKQQGFDLSSYCGLEATLYTYRVTNYPYASGEVLASLYVINNQIVGGDIHSTSMDGFMHGLR